VVLIRRPKKPKAAPKETTEKTKAAPKETTKRTKTAAEAEKPHVPAEEKKHIEKRPAAEEKNKNIKKRPAQQLLQSSDEGEEEPANSLGGDQRRATGATPPSKREMLFQEA
jgi:hypothetical protein